MNLCGQEYLCDIRWDCCHHFVSEWDFGCDAHEFAKQWGLWWVPWPEWNKLCKTSHKIITSNLSLTQHNHVYITSWKISYPYSSKCKKNKMYLQNADITFSQKWYMYLKHGTFFYKCSHWFFFTGQRVHFQVLSCNQVSLQTSLEVLSGTSCVFQVSSVSSFQLSTSDW